MATPKYLTEEMLAATIVKKVVVEKEVIRNCDSCGLGMTAAMIDRIPEEEFNEGYIECDKCREEDGCPRIQKCDECGVECDEDDWFICGDCCRLYCYDCDFKFNGTYKKRECIACSKAGALDRSKAVAPITSSKNDKGAGVGDK